MATILRYEKKFIITKDQHDSLLEKLNNRIAIDPHSKNGFYSVYNIYLDDKDKTSLRTSVERPIFKEKMRIRSYAHANDTDNVYLEIKKKYDGYGQKRRIKLPMNKVLSYIQDGIKPSVESDLDKQILEEFNQFLKVYKVKPFIYLEYLREAYYFIDNPDLRITFDTKIQYRYEELNFKENNNIQNKTYFVHDNEDLMIMEIKFMGAIPYELAQILSKLEIYRGRSSKVGNIYLKDNEEIIDGILSKMPMNNKTKENKNRGK